MGKAALVAMVTETVRAREWVIAEKAGRDEDRQR
jgi:hypothetical protein